jgi:hypothetical protein
MRTAQVTAETTDDELEAMLAVYRGDVLRRVNDKERAEDIATTVNSLAAAEGEAFVLREYRNALVHDATMPEVISHLTRIGLQEPDDAWSGRTNDTRRAYRDGVRRKVREVIQYLEIRYRNEVSQ